MKVKQFIKAHEDELIELRRAFHQIPETGYEEFKTSEKIQKYLKKLGLSPEVITETGVAAVLNEEKDGPMFMLRSDIDALNIIEETEAAYCSKHPGKMHACGHDAHIATLLMTAKCLTTFKEKIPGKVLFVFQPNEERAGALNMIKAGLLNKYPADACAAIHMWPEIKSGMMGITEGAVMAGMKHFHIIIHGKGGHTGNPHLACDPIICAANIIQSVQSIQTREINAQNPTVIMFGKLISGTVSNTIPERADLHGTIRYLYKMTDEECITKRLERHVKSIGKAYQAKVEIIWEEEHPCVFNDKEMVKLAKDIGKAIVKDTHNITDFRSTTGEDFSEFTARIPGVFCHIGTANTAKDTCYPLHSSKFNIDEEVLKYAVEFQVRIAMAWLEKNQHVL